MAINIGPFKNVIAYKAGKNGQIRFRSAFAVGFLSSYSTTFTWGINGRELGRQDAVLVDADGPNPFIEIFIEDIRAILNSVDPPVEVNNGKLDLYVNFSATGSSFGNAWAFRSYNTDGVQQNANFPEIPHPMINNPIQLDINTLQWTYPAPP